MLCVKLKRLKSLNFGGPVWGKTPNVAPPQFLLDLIYFNIYPFRKFDPSRSHGLKFQNFGGPDGRGTP